jgi:hypothetical protein
MKSGSGSSLSEIEKRVVEAINNIMGDNNNIVRMNSSGRTCLSLKKKRQP